MRKLKGANMDIDLFPNDNVSWEMDRCPWNKAEGVDIYKCAVKGVSICPYFKGIESPDTICCSYPRED